MFAMQICAVLSMQQMMSFDVETPEDIRSQVLQLHVILITV